MTILRNSAKCIHCGIEIESKHRHDFNVHYCAVKPAQKRKWIEVGDKHVIVDVPGETTWSFAVDGGKDYLKRCGNGFTDTSEYTDQERI
jgi:hypothetical protein